MRAVVKRGERKTRTYRASELQTNTWYVSVGRDPFGLKPGYVLFVSIAKEPCVLNGTRGLEITHPKVWCSEWLLVDEQTIRWDWASGRLTAEPLGKREPESVRLAVASRGVLYEVVWTSGANRNTSDWWIGRVVQVTDHLLAIGTTSHPLAIGMEHYADISSYPDWLLRPVQPEDTIVFEED